MRTLFAVEFNTNDKILMRDHVRLSATKRRKRAVLVMTYRGFRDLMDFPSRLHKTFLSLEKDLK